MSINNSNWKSRLACVAIASFSCGIVPAIGYGQGQAAAQADATAPATAETEAFGMLLRDAGTGRVVIDSVTEGGVAAGFGLEDGDIVRTVNKAPVKSAIELNRTLNALRAGEKLALGVQRGREALQVIVAGPQEGPVPTRIGWFGTILRLDARNRITVSQVAPGTAAAAAGIRPGDVLVSLGDFKPASVDDLMSYSTRMTGASRTVDELPVVMLRGDKEQKLMLALPDTSVNARGEATGPAQGRRSIVLGVTVAESDAGLVVTEVLKGSPAELAGIRPGDAVLAMNGQKVPTYAGLAETVKGIPAGQKVAVDVLRDGKAFVVNATSIATEARLPDVALEAGDTAVQPPPVELQEQVRQLQTRVDELTATVDALVKELATLRQPPQQP